MLHSREFLNHFADPRRDTIGFDDAHWDHSSVDSLGSKDLEPGLHTISHNHVDIDVLFQPVGADVTYVMFHGALESAETVLPVFAGLPGPVQDANLISICDPGLYLAEGSTWAGYEDSNGVPLSRLIPAIVTSFNVAAGGYRVVFAGEGEGDAVAARYADALLAFRREGFGGVDPSPVDYEAVRS